MSISHHSENPEALKRFLEQAMGINKREWPEGRISGEDDGVTAYAIAADPVRKIVILKFPKPMDWIGLSANDAAILRNALDAKIAELAQPSLG